jgi:hypothetical protein
MTNTASMDLDQYLPSLGFFNWDVLDRPGITRLFQDDSLACFRNR